MGNFISFKCLCINRFIRAIVDDYYGMPAPFEGKEMELTTDSSTGTDLEFRQPYARSYGGMCVCLHIICSVT